ncbi:DUF3165 family protein [Streptococcus sp. DD12]|uniref:DUF3165 family protein n=1 Tax=Streptococcus sp. DD12 TaxID=1777880 RepID=UPI000791A19E|nr:DUF3165 family protein [Streptococcus sp. DD12]KXT75762.1 hypothetical protein STRDD12_00874 [Streptococcus sp. DD12]
MVYLIISLLILLYYFFLAPATIKNTMGVILLVGLLALLLVLAVLSFMTFLELPAEVFVVLGMVAVSYWSLRDVWRLKPLTKSKSVKR